MQKSPLLPHHQASGARLAGEALITFGDVPSEYRAAVESAALFDTSMRGSLEVTGPEAGAFLHRITANAVRDLPVGGGNQSLLLTGKGKVQHTFDVARTSEAAYQLSTPGGCAPSLQAALDMYLFSEELELVDITEQHAPLELCGPKAGSIAAAALGEPPPQGDHTHLKVNATLVTVFEKFGQPAVRLDPGPDGVVELWSRLVSCGARPAGLVAQDSLRVETATAEWGRDLDENVYPQEARLEAAFSLEKGCYIGQEVVAKIDTYGGLNKRLEVLRVDDDEPVPPGTRLFKEEEGEWRDLGMTTTWAYSFAMDGGAVLAYVKRKHQEAGTTFRLGDGPRTGTIVELPQAPTS